MLINNDTIIKDSDPILRVKSKDVPLPINDEDKNLLLEMFQYVKESTDEKIAKEKNLRPAVGISAIQLGIPKKLIAIRLVDVDKNNKEIVYEYCLVNPKIVSRSTQKSYLDSGEGCLSVVDAHEGHVIRNARISIEAYDLLQDKNIQLRARGYLAIVIQHEIDHLDGILFYDHIDNNDPFKEVQDALVI